MAEIDPKYIEEVVDKILKEYTINIDKKDNIPTAIILGGQPGAGKTILQKIYSSKIRNLIVINGDDYRQYHPDFEILNKKYGKESVKYTGPFAAQVTEALIKRISEEHYNVLVEGTLRTAEVPLKTCNDFKEKGYNVILGIIAVKPQISFISTILRYEQMLDKGETPRATPKEHHDMVVSSLFQNLEKIYEAGKFDNIQIFNRNRECIYDMIRDKEKQPHKILEEQINGKWSLDELKSFIIIGTKIINLKNARKSNDIGEFKNLFFNADIIKQIIQENKMVDTITLVELGFDEEDSYQNVKSRRNGYDDKSESRE